MKQTEPTLEALRAAYIIAYRAYCDEWLTAYEDVHNVSFAEKKALTTDNGMHYLRAKLQYEEATRYARTDE